MANEPASLLIVDDDEGPLTALDYLLRDRGYKVTATRSANEALELARKHPYAAVISDQQMDEMLGLDLLQAIRLLQPLTSRVLVTGVRSLEVVVDAINRGEIFRFVAKPYMRAEMLATVGNAIQRYEMLCENQRLNEETRALNAQLAEANGKLCEQVVTLEQQKRELEESRTALKSNLDRSLELCHRLLSTFDPVLGRQTRTVVSLCEAMTETANFTPEDKHVLIVSAWLHDIGLAGLPHEASRYNGTDPRKLPDEIGRIVRDHPIYGQTLASFVDSLRSVGDTIRAHHEYFDGSGYPDGLARESIPWTARCLAVADYYAGSTTPHDETVDRILQLSGRLFDPEAVRIFLRANPNTSAPRPYKEVTVAELSPGMELAKGIYSPTGLLLIAEGQRLDESTIGKLRKHSALTSLPQQLYVLA
jgi:response regulator RpfG family c-di-GMP phosphodiesterase